jgi:organic radical activating enzyme
MPNLIITHKCNDHCSFCFNANSGADLTPEQLYGLLPFLQSFQRETIQILGGEPSLNPHFLDLVDILLAEGYHIRIFTNGNLSPSQIKALALRQNAVISFGVNRSSPKLSESIKKLYQSLGHCVQLGVTVYQIGQNFTYLFEEINRYHLALHYRIGIAMPVWPHRINTSLHPHDYAQVAQEILQQIQQGVLFGITPEFDCGFPDCFFNSTQKDFFQDHQIQFAAHCGLIPDVCPDFCLPCFPLSNFAESIQAGAVWAELEPKLLEKLNKKQKNYLFPACEECKVRLDGFCQGGCLAWRL